MSKNHYLDNERFEELIQGYLIDKKSHEDELMASLEVLTINIIETFKFKVDKEDAKQDCLFLVLKKLQNFKNEKGTAFNYFTTVIINNLRLIYSKEKKYNEKIENYILLFGPDRGSSNN
jgi:DNA-directed RNA polymerase specialized sigma24 family protein